MEVSEELNDKQQKEAKDLIKKEKEIFAQSVEELGRTERTNHVIDTGDAAPIKQNAYRAAPGIKEFIKNEITQLKKRGLIRESQSPWSSPVVVVPKKGGKLRLCIDYRKLNAVTKKDSYPLPRVDDLLETFSKARWFSSLDLLSGYWQLPVNEKDKEKTAFVTSCGTYEFNVMPFGLCNAPASFQRLMDKILADEIGKFVVVYLDDINIYSENFDEHLDHISVIFKKLKESGLKLNFEKCTFFRSNICFLGHVVGRDGIKPDESKIEKVKNFPIPKTLRQLRGFIGLASYYRRFIKDFATIARPLHHLLKKNVEYKWNNDQNYAFESLKRHLITAPILRYPDFLKTFFIHTDASGSGLGAVLSQKDDDDKEFVVSYASRGLTLHEKNYAATELECLAILWAVEHFHHYYGLNPFVVITDHSALKWLKTSKLTGRRARWMLRLQPYDFTIQHRKGRKHSNADA
ncbi:12058_t:CDS:1, partial [Dentiscutata erythropus]